MTQEEKEKRYEEALAKAREIRNEDGKRFDMEWLFPELKESEDERIRKHVISVLEDCWQTCKNIDYDSSRIQEDIAWLEKQGEHFIYNVPSREVVLAIWDLGNEWRELTNGSISTEYGTQLNYIQKHWRESEYYLREKQGEQKSTNKNEPKFHKDEWITNGDYTWKIVDVTSLDYILQSQDGNIVDDTISYVDEQFHSFKIQDAKDGDVLDANGAPFIYKKHDKNYVYCYCGVNLADEFIKAKEICAWNNLNKVYPATKEQRDTLFAKMKEAGYEWNADKNTLKKIVYEEYNGEDCGIDSLWHAKNTLEKTLGSVEGYQSDDGILEHKCAISAVKKLYDQKPTWSEEDERMMYLCCVTLDVDQASWLLSLKERYTWKPSDEQIDALEEAMYQVGILAPLGSKINDLYEQLKKLKGE